jgi:cell division protein ZapE
MSPAEILAGFTPPPTFSGDRATFSTYRPDPGEPSQSAAVTRLERFSASMSQGQPKARGLFRRSRPTTNAGGIYLDGGFGVGKTHLLAALWHSAPGPKTYGTFVEYTNLVGALGFAGAVEVLGKQRLVCIDEFELDDPGDTVLMASLLSRLVEGGVRLAATSNTLPDRLGEGRFAAEDFMREIQGLASHFEVHRIDGQDYRHRGVPTAPEPLSDAQVAASAQSTENASLDHFADLTRHLEQVHPSQFGALLQGVSVVHIVDVRALRDQSAALRWVVLVDRMYDKDLRVVASGVPLDGLFSAEMLAGGYRKKYYRALSRLVAMSRDPETAAD